MSDIRRFALEQSAAIHLRDGADNLMYADDKDTKPMVINVYGPGTKAYAAAEKRNTDRMMENLRRKGKTADAAEMRVDFLVAITKSFENIEYDKLEGEALYRAVYSDTSIRFIADQVNAYVGETSNFTKNSQKS
jgi:hypothetical protein